MTIRKLIPGSAAWVEAHRNLVNATEIARRVGVNRAAVANWAARYPGFPAPVTRLLYDWREVETWLRATGHPKPRYIRPKHHVVIHVANPVDDHRFAPQAWRP